MSPEIDVDLQNKGDKIEASLTLHDIQIPGVWLLQN